MIDKGENMTSTGASSASPKPRLCRLGWHTSTFLDAALCFGSTRCNRCLSWLTPENGARVATCRRYADKHGMHIPLACRSSRSGDQGAG